MTAEEVGLPESSEGTGPLGRGEERGQSSCGKEATARFLTGKATPGPGEGSQT